MAGAAAIGDGLYSAALFPQLHSGILRPASDGHHHHHGKKADLAALRVGIRASKFQMYNTPCQGTGADLIKLVMCEVYDKISSQEARIINSIHDEILLEVPEERAEEYALMLQEIMERIGSELLHPVPVKAEVRIMSSLAE